MNATTPFPARALVGLIVCLEIVTACRKEPATPARRPAPTAEIRHRDAYPLMLTLSDLGAGYQASGVTRLERGKGWAEEATRLSGYRAAYQGTGTTFSSIECQVECYLSIRDGQSAYRALKAQLATQIQNEGKYTTVNESETSVLGEWGWLFHMRNLDQDTFLYVFVRENVLVQASLTGVHTAELADQAVRLAQVVDQRVMVR